MAHVLDHELEVGLLFAVVQEDRAAGDGIKELTDAVVPCPVSMLGGTIDAPRDRQFLTCLKYALLFLVLELYLGRLIDLRSNRKVRPSYRS